MENNTVSVDLGERSYDIVIGAGLDLSALCADLNGRRGLVITDSHVGPLHADRICKQLEACGAVVSLVDVPAGEATKSLDVMPGLFSRAIQHGMDRSSFMCALGGGMIGDLVGFTAATYLRGIEFIQLPTSLLAMVDSSVGGKTGVNLPEGKNLVGSFYQPSRVLADLNVLKTLSKREFLSGMAEVVKYGIIYDSDFFDFIEQHVDDIQSMAPDVLAQLVKRSCEIKADVVAKDEREGGLRAILNYGHTLGHAIEQVDGYGAWLHGEAISIGMVYASRLSVQSAGLSEDEAERISALLKRLDLPTRRVTSAAVSLERQDIPWSELRDVMSADKKSKASIPRFVLADAIGKVRFGCEVTEACMEETWNVCH
jgi:3-dehydroquinate synthase